MKLCSYCGRDNEDAAAACCECGTEFSAPKASEIDPQLGDPTLNLVIVGTFATTTEASIVKTRLEAAGIEACIPEEYSPQLFGSTPSLMERVTVRVAAKNYEAAQRVLASAA